MTSFGFFNETSKAISNRVMDVSLNGVVMNCREMLPLLEKSSTMSCTLKPEISDMCYRIFQAKMFTLRLIP